MVTTSPVLIRSIGPPSCVSGQVIEVHVAGVATAPDAGNPDLGLVHIVFGVAPFPRGLEQYHKICGPRDSP